MPARTDDVSRSLIAQGLMDEQGRLNIAVGEPAELRDGLVWFSLAGDSPARVLAINVREAGATVSITLATF